jgi:hypothetical protein
VQITYPPVLESPKSLRANFVRYFTAEKIEILNFKYSRHILKSNIHDTQYYFYLKSKITGADISVAGYDSPKQENVG